MSMDPPEFPRIPLVEMLPEGTADGIQKLLEDFGEKPLHDIFINEPSLGERMRLVRAMDARDPETEALQLQTLLKTSSGVPALTAPFIANAPASRLEPMIAAVRKWFYEYSEEIADYRKAIEKARKVDEYIGERDDLFEQAVEVIRDNKRVSISLIQRYMQIGYNRAARIVEQMEKARIVSPPDAAGNRKILKLPDKER